MLWVRRRTIKKQEIPSHSILSRLILAVASREEHPIIGDHVAKRTFLVSIAAAVAALSGTSEAAIDKGQSTPVTQDAVEATAPDTVLRPNPLKEGELLLPIGDDIFKYVLKRGESGEIFADHQSHASHASHASHHSHYSSR